MLISLSEGVLARLDPFHHKFIAPGPNDERSPCPGLNALANHGYLPRSGQNFTVPEVLEAATEVYNLDWPILLSAAKQALLTRTDKGSETLLNTTSHNLLEQDASLSRNDFGDGTGDNLHFNETIFSTLANANPGVDYYNTTSAGAVQFARLQYSLATNPDVVNTQKEALARSGASALYLSVMGDPLTGVAPKKFVQIFFREERLPIQEGWQKSKTPITLETIGALIGAIQGASNWTPSTACGPVVLGPGVVFNSAH
ncbi:Cloroperoxidase [Mycena amicta]|nr:Cloroperoxidase [Mycena amicta]